MRATLLILLLLGCGQPINHPALTDEPAEALATWNRATGGRMPELKLSFVLSDIDRAGKIEPPSIIHISTRLPRELRRRALLHEIGHAMWIMPEPESGDPYHYRGPAPSVMHPDLDECSDEIGRPELAAFERKYGTLVE
jgi:hypothetical protein